MNAHRWALGMTALNAAMFVALVLTFGRLATLGAAGAPSTSPTVLRGTALEIVDARGRVRASIDVLAADPTTGDADRVILRMADQNGRPEIKILATERGATVGLAGATDASRLALSAQGTEASLRLITPEGERLVRP